MPVHITESEALWFLPLVLPICLWVAFSDLKSMKIRNTAVLALTAIFLVVGLIALPFAEYPWRIVTMIVVLFVGIIVNAAGLAGAGDAKFIAAASAFIDPDDIFLLCTIFTANVLAAFIAHRIAMHTPLRNLAPSWVSWQRKNKFPMGFSLGSTLAIYLLLGATCGN